MANRFVAAMRAVDPDITAEALSDVIWLAERMRGLQRESPLSAFPVGQPGSPGDGETGPWDEGEPAGAVRAGSPPAPREQPPPPATERIPVREELAALHLPPRRLLSDDPGVRIRSPAVPAIPDSLAICRALRPLQRRALSATRSRPDENATAQAIAQTGLWVPTVRPVFERWLDLALVIDDSASMGVWHRTAVELRALLQQSGAFRDIRVWLMDGDLSRSSRLSVSSESSLGGAGRDPSELVDPTGRRLILVASDCVGRAWATGAAGAAMKVWGSAGPTAIVQMLPQRLWADCPPEFIPVRLRAPRSGAPNGRLVVQGRLADLDHDVVGIPIPVLELEARWLKPWAALVAGATDRWVNGTAVFTGLLTEQQTHADADAELETATSLTPKEQLQRFRAHASPEAYQLSICLAGAPLSLPVMRLVQGAMLPSTRPSHLAEVFLSDLLCRVGDEDEDYGLGPDDIEYDFRPGVRAELLAELARQDALQVLSRVSTFVSERIGSPLDFRALLTADEIPHPPPDLSPPFARVAYQVLRSLGGRYAEAADRLYRLSDIRRVMHSTHPNLRSDDAPEPTGSQGETLLSTTPPIAPASDRQGEVLPRIMRGVPLRNPHFTGRDELLTGLREQLVRSSERTALLPHALHGLGGVGKTQLAVEYVHRSHEGEAYDLIWWVPAEDPAHVRASLLKLGAELGLPESDDATRMVNRVLDTLRASSGRWLLVFDNADRPEDIAPYLPYPTGHVLITSRNLGWSEVASTIEVDVFSRKESIDLLSDRGPAISAEDADRLAERLGDLPLALEQAAAWRAETGMWVDEYLQLFDEQLERLTEHPPGNYPASVGATYQVAFDRLRDQSPGAAQLLELFSFFGAKPIPVTLLWDGRAAELPSPLDEILRDRLRLRRAMREIGKYALARIDPERDRISVHRLVQAVLRARLTPGQQDDTRRTVQRILAQANPGEPDERDNWDRQAELSPHVQASGAIDAEDTEVRKVVLDQIRYRYVRSDYESSRELGELAVDAWVARWGEDEELTLIASRHLANAMRQLGYLEQARALAEDTLARLRRVFGDDHEHTLSTADTVAWDLRISGNFDEARALDEDNLTRHRRVFGEDHPITLRIAHNVAIDLRWLGDYEGARRVDEDSVRRRRATFGNEDRRTQYTVGSLARDLYGLGRYREALELQEGALLIQGRILDPNDSEVLEGIHNQVIILRKVGEYQRGRAVAKDLIQRNERRFGPDGERTLAARMSYANILRHTGELDEARELGEDTLRRYRYVYGADHPFALSCASNLAIVLRHLDANEAALELNEATLAAFRRVFGPDHQFTLCCATNKGNDLATLHHHDAARELSEDTLRRSRRVRGEDHPSTWVCVLNAALDLRETGDEEQANSLLAQAGAGLARQLGEDHPEARAASQGKRIDCEVEPPET